MEKNPKKMHQKGLQTKLSEGFFWFLSIRTRAFFIPVGEASLPVRAEGDQK